MPDDKGITLAEAKLALARWMTADAELAGGLQEVRVNTEGIDKVLRRTDAAEIRKNIQYWEEKVRDLSGQNVIRFYGVIPPC